MDAQARTLTLETLEGGDERNVAEWKSSEDRWPRHTCKEWNDTLDFARASGWYFKPLGHRFGEVVCRLTTSGAACKIKIDSTASGTESFARDSRLEIERCPHRPVGDEPEPLTLVQCEKLLAQVDVLLIAAKRCCLGHRKLHEAHQLLDQAETQLESLELAALVEASGVQLLRQASAAAAGLGVCLASEGEGAASAAMPEPALDASEERLDRVSAVAPVEASGWEVIRDRVAALRREVTDLRAQTPQAPSPP